jgi:hypothetical protein
MQNVVKRPDNGKNANEELGKVCSPSGGSWNTIQTVMKLLQAGGKG